MDFSRSGIEFKRDGIEASRVLQVLPTNVIQVTETQGISGDFGGSL